MAAGLSLIAATPATLPKDVTRVPVVFSGGHDTNPRDRGRPVVLIASALGVTSDVFRDAFSNVHPAGPGRGPTGEEARANKAVLMKALGKHGITNDRLDTVSNYYRYPPGRGGLWRVTPASANALVKNGAVVGFELLDPGSGYSSTPEATIQGLPDARVDVQLGFSKSFEKNGSVSALTVVQEGKK